MKQDSGNPMQYFWLHFSLFQHPSSYGMAAAPDQLSLNGYYPAGYPVLYEPDTRVVNYKNVVKELEDAKR